MASPEARAILDSLRRSDPANQQCVNCFDHNPQWVCIKHAVWICLSCSGVHRSLGVHISFVRSVTMDKWKPEELEKMKVRPGDPVLSVNCSAL